MRTSILLLALLALPLMAGDVLFVPPGTVSSTDIVVATISPVDIGQPGRGSFSICGDAVTIDTNTIYYGPLKVLVANISDGAQCNINTTGSTVEVVVADIVYLNKAFAVLAMTCRNEKDADSNISFTFRSAGAVTTPSVTCTISDNDRDCVADVQTTTDIAAGATVAVAAAAASDIGINNGFNCQVEVAF